MSRRTSCFTAALLLTLVGNSSFAPAAEPDAGRPWTRHAIDNSSRGADGVRLADVNADGRLDIATGWEEGGITRVYLHPGGRAAKEPWPAVTVGRTPNVEDAVLVDLDADGRTDVVSCCEGKMQAMLVHWAPEEAAEYLDPNAWKTEPIPASQGRMMWMFAAPLALDGRHGVDLVAGGKGPRAAIGWFEAPSDPRRLAAWKWHPISEAGWIMSLKTVDVDGDGDADVLTSDRKGPLRGCRWLENPGPGPQQAGPWKNHFLGGRDHEVMFLALGNRDARGLAQLFCATRDAGLMLLDRAKPAADWTSQMVPLPEGVGTGKGVARGDVDLDGRLDLVFTCEHANGELHGVMWLSPGLSASDPAWTPHAISGPQGIKFDRVELLDLDGDGDLDVLTCEESHRVDGRRKGLGVVWYENPAKGRG